MISFELKNVINSSFVEQEIGGIKMVIFTTTPVVGIVGNTYEEFTNTKSIVIVECLKSDTGTEMDNKILLACTEFVAINFPPIG